MSLDMFPDGAIQHILDWRDTQQEGLIAGLLDSRDVYGELLHESIREAEGRITFGSDLKWLDEEGFLA